MSLLLEALKKAEKAKEEAQRQAQAAQTGGTPLPPSDPESSASAARELELEPMPPPPTTDAVAVPPKMTRPNTDPRAGGQDLFREANARRPFYASLGVLGVIAAFIVVYFWVQVRPLAALLNASSSGAGTGRSVETAATPSDAGVTAKRERTPGDAAIPGLPEAKIEADDGALSVPAARSGTRTPRASSGAAAQPRQAKQATPGTSVATPVATPASVASHGEPRVGFSAYRVALQANPSVVAGYASYQVGNLPEAHGQYQQALQEDPANRDALLGLAAVEMRAQRYDQAEAYYERLLQADPRDPHAHAGMLALHGGRIDPVQAESRVKSLLASDPGANVLYFTLGNQYAQQRRWAEAQQAYFRAYAADSENPDFAFNLAVSLDRLSQSALALEYYRRALALAERRAASFSPELARQREQQLSR